MFVLMVCMLGYSIEMLYARSDIDVLIVCDTATTDRQKSGRCIENLSDYPDLQDLVSSTRGCAIAGVVFPITATVYSVCGFIYADLLERLETATVTLKNGDIVPAFVFLKEVTGSDRIKEGLGDGKALGLTIIIFLSTCIGLCICVCVCMCVASGDSNRASKRARRNLAASNSIGAGARAARKRHPVAEPAQAAAEPAPLSIDELSVVIPVNTLGN